VFSVISLLPYILFYIIKTKNFLIPTSFFFPFFSFFFIGVAFLLAYIIDKAFILIMAFIFVVFFNHPRCVQHSLLVVDFYIYLILLLVSLVGAFHHILKTITYKKHIKKKCIEWEEVVPNVLLGGFSRFSFLFFIF